MVCKVAKTTAPVPAVCLVVSWAHVARVMRPFMMPFSRRRFSTAVLNRMSLQPIMNSFKHPSFQIGLRVAFVATSMPCHVVRTHLPTLAFDRRFMPMHPTVDSANLTPMYICPGMCKMTAVEFPQSREASIVQTCCRCLACHTCMAQAQHITHVHGVNLRILMPRSIPCVMAHPVLQPNQVYRN